MAASTASPAELRLHEQTRLAQQELTAGEALKAARRLETALATSAGTVAAWNLLGSARVELKLWSSAEVAFWEVVRRAPDTFPCWYNLLVCACRSSAPLDTLAARWRMVQAVLTEDTLTDDERRAHLRRVALELRDQGDPTVHAPIALEAAQRWLALDGGDEARVAMARALNLLGRFEEALPLWHAVGEQRPHDLYVMAHWGMALAGCDRYDEAVACYRRVLALDPNCHGVMHNLMYALQFLGEQDEGLQWLNRALQLEENPRYRMARAVPLLRAGHYEQGFADYEHRLSTYQPGTTLYEHAFRLRDAGIPMWQGESLEGKRIFVHPEQGHGDFIMCARLIPRLQDLGAAQVGFFAVNNLERYGRALDLGAMVHYQSEALVADYDGYVTLLSLMHFLKLRTPADIPPPVAPVIDARTQQLWQIRIDPRAVGLTWRGSALHSMDRYRTVGFEDFVHGVVRPLQAQGLPLVSLQKDMTEPERTQLQALGVNCEGIAQCADWYDSAALVQQLQAVVGVDTALIHLSGSLGVPTVMINRLDALSDWRWLTNRSDSPWYPSLHIVRQTRLLDWAAPMAEAVQAVLARTELRRDSVHAQL